MRKMALSGALRRRLELTRIEAVAGDDFIGLDPEVEFDRIVDLAVSIFDVPIASISIIKDDRHFFKAKIGIDASSSDEVGQFCSYAIDPASIFVVKDTEKDARFAHKPRALGEPHIRFCAGVPLCGDTGLVLGTLCIMDTRPRSFDDIQSRRLKQLAELVLDRLELRKQERKLRANEQFLQNICDSSSSALISTDEKGRIIFFNRAAQTIFACNQKRALRSTIEKFIPSGSESAPAAVECAAFKHVPTKGFTEKVGRRFGGDTFPVSVAHSTWCEGENLRHGYVVNDITERRRALERLEHLAHIDQLSGLANRALFLERAAHQLAETDGEVASLLLFDLDGFKDVNDVLGHSAGDQLLAAVGNRLSRHVGNDQLLARLGGDEFVVFLRGVADPREAYRFAQGLRESFRQPFRIDNQDLQLDTSIGVALAPYHGRTIEALLVSADLALYHAKARGGGSVGYFEPHLKHRVENRRQLQTELRDAFAADEFEILYQPQVNLRNREISGAEALLRWNHPDHGLLAPSQFLTILDQMPLAAAVGDWVLRSAISQAAEWRRAGMPVRVSVNLFAAQLLSGHLPDLIAAELKMYDLPANLLELEVTETIALKGSAVIVSSLNAVRQLGVGIALDDFGTGYATLSFLKEFPVTRLKIDQGFVRDMNPGSRDAAVVDAVVRLGEIFNLKVIAEGVENLQQEQLLLAAGCHEVQGFLYGRPQSAAQIAICVSSRYGQDRMGALR